MRRGSSGGCLQCRLNQGGLKKFVQHIFEELPKSANGSEVKFPEGSSLGSFGRFGDGVTVILIIIGLTEPEHVVT